ncbi:hypothetical protein B0H14DRAFT_3045594 [Mycena olivaceomarginata]|nr:hypothetical protein B0H14DRAFT_3045594 [Mycena olivaceomarginata]
MNADVLAGASDVIECFVKELAVLQGHIKAEETRLRAARAEADEATRDQEELGLSLMCVTKIALDMTRQRLAKERTAKKREALEARERHRIYAERAAETERDLREKLANLQAALDERNEELGIAKKDLHAARQDTLKARSELVELKSHSDNCERTADDDTTQLGLNHTLKEKDGELEAVLKEMVQAHAQMAVRDEELERTRKQLRFAVRTAAGARSTAAISRARQKTARMNCKATKEELKNEQAAHEELKLTCRQLIDILEAPEEAVKADKTKSPHSRDKTGCKYKTKYKMLKAKTRGLQTKSSDLGATVEAGFRKRKVDGEMEQQNKQRIKLKR